MAVLIDEDNSWLIKVDNFLGKADSDTLFEYCKKLDLIVEPRVKTGVCHRCVGFYSYTSIGYKFSGQIMKSKPLPQKLKEIQEKVGNYCKTNLNTNTVGNSTLINYYRDGTDYIGVHSDSEADLYKHLICAISLGGSRKFRIKRKNGVQFDGKNFMDVITGHGQLIIMAGDFQDHFTHEVPAGKTTDNPERVSLTFRHHYK